MLSQITDLKVLSQKEKRITNLSSNFGEIFNGKLTMDWINTVKETSQQSSKGPLRNLVSIPLS